MSGPGAMTPERWRQIKAALDGAMDRSPSERDDWLAATYPDDPELRTEVEALLDAEADAPAFLDGPAAEYGLPLVPSLEAPRTVGAYRLLDEVGRGGMGVVYRAERADGAYDQRVAVKLLAGVGGAERFRAERQILASLAHPGIARLLDGGVTEAGSPYLVMEYIEGRPIDQHCDEERLTVDERLDLFAEVGRAVAVAHRNLVVHRDLKPSNILVTPEGRVKLLDFGIARLLEPDADAAPLTRPHQRMMTPEFAAPEQVRGEAITTATDVYQLGVLLYTLVCGVPPIRADGDSLVAVERAVCEQTPCPPGATVDASSTDRADLRSTTPGRLRATLRGDLGTIALKALRKEPERRYASAAELVDDVERYRKGLPVTARPESARYRARLFVRRHRWGVGVAALAVMVAAGALALYTARVTAERDRAERAARQAERTTDFLTDLFLLGDRERGDAKTVAATLTVLEPAAAKIETELAGEPEVQAALLQALGEVYWDAGAIAEAQRLLRRALDLRRRLHPPPHPHVAQALHAYGLAAGDSAAHYFEAAAAMHGALGDPTAQATSLVRLASALPANHLHRGPSFDRAIALLSRHHGPDSPQVADALNDAYGLAVFSDSDDAERAIRRVLRIYRATYGEGDLRTAQALHNLGLIVDGDGRPEGLGYLRRSHALARDEVGADHPEVTLMAVNLGATLYEHGRLGEAENVLREAVLSRRATLPDSSTAVAYALYWHGVALCADGRPADGLRALREARAIWRRSPGGAAGADAALSEIEACS